MTKIYQPQTKDKELPQGLFSWQVFKSEEHARYWLTEYADPEKQYDIVEYDELDIEDFEFVNVGEPIFYLYCGWEEKHYGSSDPATHDCSVLYSFKSKETALVFLKEEIEKIKGQIKDDLDVYDYEFEEDNLTIEKNEYYEDYYKVIYRTEWVKFEYNLFIQEGELL